MQIQQDLVYIEIVIATCNNVNTIDKTIESIKKQSFPKEQIYIYIVDFGSTDGTYEKILQYEPYHTGVFQMGKISNERCMMSEAAMFPLYEPAGGQYCYTVALYPGDVIYPTFLEICAEAMLKNIEHNPRLLVCEADIEGNKKQKIKRIADKECVLQARDIPESLAKNHYRHYIGCFGGKLKTTWHRYLCLGNERCFVDKLIFSCDVEDCIVYLPDKLICMAERNYSDEIEEILIHWESIILYQRRWNIRAERKINDDIQEILLNNLSRYCLWRIYKKYAEMPMAEKEDILRIAEIINSDIKETQIYKNTYQLIYSEDLANFNYCMEYYDKEDEETKWIF